MRRVCLKAILKLKLNPTSHVIMALSTFVYTHNIYELKHVVNMTVVLEYPTHHNTHIHACSVV